MLVDRVRAAIVLAFVALVWAHPLHAQTYFVPAALGIEGKANSVNDLGQVAGYYNAVDGSVRAMIWSAAGGLIDLGISGWAEDINNTGQVIGCCVNGHGFSWTQAGGVTDIGSLGGGLSFPNAVNNNGQVVGKTGGFFRAFSWTSAAGMIDLGTLGGVESEALDVNDAGVVVGWSLAADGISHGFIWTASGGMVDLGIRVRPEAINNAGQVVGSRRSATGSYSAFRWTQAGGFIDLGTLGVGVTSIIEALDISGDGTIVGRAIINLAQPPQEDNHYHAFIWTQATGILPLEHVGLLDPGAFSEAVSINNTGLIAGRRVIGFLGGPAVWSRPSAADVIADFGSYGLWKLGERWSFLHRARAEAMVRADVDGNGVDDLAVDFGPAYGVWLWMNHATWRPVHSISPDCMVAGNLNATAGDELVFHFVGFGVWSYTNSGAWMRLTPQNVSHLAIGNVDGAAGDDVVVDVPGAGLWMYANNNAWSQIHPLDVSAIVIADLDGEGKDEVVANFPGHGLWSYWNNSTWAALTSASSTGRVAAGQMDANDRADLVVDFGTAYGVWTLRNGDTWVKFHSSSAEEMLLTDRDGNGQDEVLVDFGPAYGLWQYSNDSVWSQLHLASPGALAAGRFH